MNLDCRIALINDQPRLNALCEGLGRVPTLALDIETTDWWCPHSERVALIQLAYRVKTEVRVALVDPLTRLDPTTLRQPLERNTATKVMHNAAFDAVRLARHFQIHTAPIHDTQLAARRSGERRYSLKAQAEKHLNLRLDKQAQLSDWGLRPLRPAQLSYAAQDALATLLLYEHQVSRGLRGDYRLRAKIMDEQGALPLHDSLTPDGRVEGPTPAEQLPPESAELSDPSLALLGIIVELPSRYGPEQLAVSLGAGRVGLAGWIIDRVLGEDADVDESSARIMIEGLCQRGLVRVTPTRRLEANESGREIWQKQKPI